MYLVPLIFALAFIYFLWGTYRFFILGKGSEEAVAQGKQFFVWSIVGFVVMISVWGIVNVVIGSLPINPDAQPKIPTFSPNGSTGTTNTTNNTSCQGVLCPFGTRCQVGTGLCVPNDEVVSPTH